MRYANTTDTLAAAQMPIKYPLVLADWKKALSNK